ncbi:hypothetical protein JB92DRAFT_2810383 [Gautieria morchelliformis]|nr:hypothetical protein JB92DRAFT_2810383 [Gautieria morchelliformis]
MVVRLSRIQAPSHRHAAPCGPWPWMDLRDDIEPASLQLSSEPHQCPHPTGQCEGCWAGYPQSLFPNWTKDQVARSRMKQPTTQSARCVIRRVEVKDGGEFCDPGSQRAPDNEEFWRILQESVSNKRADNVRVRALFVENISVPVLQMLGTKYKVEPFFWTSSVNWIPSRYQEDFREHEGDHITITLSFPRATKRDAVYSPSQVARVNTNISTYSTAQNVPPLEEVINTQKPLPLRSDDPTTDDVLILDHLAMHMLRAKDSSTIISYQPTFYREVTTASSLHSRVYLAGQSVYWNKIFRGSNDPTFVFLTILWYALYAWDQALERLWEHICQLELEVIELRSIKFTQELHIVRARLLHYASLLDDFCKSVEFVRDTPNPAMDSDSNRFWSKKLLDKECKNLLIQIERLSASRVSWDKRLQNIMQLAFSSVNLEDSKRMKKLTEAAVRDSTAMKQIAYLTMVFLPASFVSNAFGMNVIEINPDSSGTLGHYFATALPLTALTMWFVVALQGNWEERDENGNLVARPWWVWLSWPVMYWERLVARNNRETARNSVKSGWLR